MSRTGAARAARSLSFGGCGWSMTWSLGFAERLRSLEPLGKFAGASGGALVASTLALGLDQGEVLLAMQDSAARLGEKGPYGALRNTGVELRRMLDEILPPDANVTLSKSLTVSITLVDPLPRNELVSEFSSREDLMDALFASSFIPYYIDGQPYTTFRGNPAIDGGVSNNSPIIDDDTFLISPFPGVPLIMPPYDACPFPKSRAYPLSFTLRNLAKLGLFPDPHQLKDLYHLGQDAAERFHKQDPSTPAWKGSFFYSK
mmetsp:Transcript_9849/g.17317  ORF Transcript_9849/g.17317 Transcript_9849/m.17317 type:complete len:259 (+) Transcript_9849:3-779(+)